MCQQSGRYIPLTYYQAAPVATLRGHTQKYVIPFARTFAFQRSFFLDSIGLWNLLPQETVGCATLDQFRRDVQHIQHRHWWEEMLFTRTGNARSLVIFWCTIHTTLTSQTVRNTPEGGLYFKRRRRSPSKSCCFPSEFSKVQSNHKWCLFFYFFIPFSLKVLYYMYLANQDNCPLDNSPTDNSYLDNFPAGQLPTRVTPH